MKVFFKALGATLLVVGGASFMIFTICFHPPWAVVIMVSGLIIGFVATIFLTFYHDYVRQERINKEKNSRQTLHG